MLTIPWLRSLFGNIDILLLFLFFSFVFHFLVVFNCKFLFIFHYLSYSCMRCCFWCLENFIKFINKNAFIMIAIYGKNFCSSAKDAFGLLLNNGIRAVVLNFLSDFLLLLSKLAVTGLGGVIGYFVLTNGADFLVQFDDLNYYWAPLTVSVCILFKSLFSLYNVCVCF